MLESSQNYEQLTDRSFTNSNAVHNTTWPQSFNHKNFPYLADTEPSNQFFQFIFGFRS